jgi:hypothetical protein
MPCYRAFRQRAAPRVSVDGIGVSPVHTREHRILGPGSSDGPCMDQSTTWAQPAGQS